MALRIWIPLNGNIENQGTDNASFIQLGQATFLTAGKCGNSLQNVGNTTSACSLIYDITNFNPDEWTIAAWVNPSSSYYAEASYTHYVASLNQEATPVTGSIIFSNYGQLGFRINDVALTIRGHNGLDAWTHVCLTYKNQEAKLYYDGKLIYTKTVTAGPTPTHFTFGGLSGQSSRCPGLFNDIRLYDNCLSVAEIKEISQGLILHYKFDNLPCLNLIRNGYGELGTQNWTPVNNNTNQLNMALPSDANIKNGYFNSTASDYIPIDPNHKYFFSTYIRSDGTSGNVYPSFFTYDIDKKRIEHYHVNFIAGTNTTLAQDLNPGDTVIYVTNLSGWSNGKNNSNYAAIFGYKDSTGYTYPDNTYTRWSLQFWTGNTTIKDNLDFNNNSITLRSAYNGPTIPAGTTIAQATAGAAYYYPVGGVAKAQVPNWTFKSADVNPLSTTRLKYTKYLRYFTSSHTDSYNAGVFFIDKFYQPNTEEIATPIGTIYDSSGFHNNGLLYGLHTSIDGETPCYSQGIHFSNTNQRIIVMNFPTEGFGYTYTFAWWGRIANNNTMYWSFNSNVNQNVSRLNGIYKGTLWNTFNGNNNPLYIPGTTTQVTAPEVNTWHHWAMVGTMNECLVYQDGELWGVASYPTSINGLGLQINGALGYSTYTSTDMSISDFRVYCTALSAEDVKKLYNTTLRVTSMPAVHTKSLNELGATYAKRYIPSTPNTAWSYDSTEDIFYTTLPASNTTQQLGGINDDISYFDWQTINGFKADIWSSQATTISINYTNSPGIGATSGGTLNDTAHSPATIEIPAETWTTVYFSSANTNGTLNPQHVVLSDSSTFVIPAHSSAITFKIRLPVILNIPSSTNIRVNKNSVLTSGNFIETDTCDNVSLRKYEKLIESKEFFET